MSDNLKGIGGSKPPTRSTRSTRPPAPKPDGGTSGGVKGSALSGGKGSSGAKAPPSGSTPPKNSGGSKNQQPKKNDGASSGKSGDTSKVKNPSSNEKTDKKEDMPSKGSSDSKMSDGAKGKNDKDGKGGGASGLVKNGTANATGVDYSDKSMKDQLKHQAADVAMDATPVVGQVNAGRKALKNFNKQKKDATGRDNDVSDKVEKVADDALDKGLDGIEKAGKIAAGGAVAGQVGMMALMGAIVMKGVGMIKAGVGFFLGLLAKVGNFIGGIISTAGSFISGLIGVTAAVGNGIVAGGTAILVTVGGFFGFGVVEEITNVDDSVVECVPSQTSVSSGSQEYILDGEHDLIREENAKKLWSVYSELGGTKAKTAAVLGNLDHESSGLDPTSIETIYDEPFQIGPRKQHAMDNDFLVSVVAPSYGAEHDAITYMGIGLAQWTNDRNRLLIEYADEIGRPWYEFDTQMMFMLAGDQEFRQDQLIEFITGDGSNVDEETDVFKRGWIGNNNDSLGVRQEAAREYMFILERATADVDYAESILSNLDVNRSAGNASAGAYHRDDGCGNAIKSHYGNQAVDGTGEVPSDLELVPWSRETLPTSLHEFAKNPEDAGLQWGTGEGWETGGIAILPDQCVALAQSYFMALYPDWNKEGRPTVRMPGDGRVTAPNWAVHYGESTSSVPQAGAVFSDTTTSVYGHTGIVQHVFANGDILIVEQNIRGVSGAGAGLNYSWSWRVIKQDRYDRENWVFFKPANYEPQWSSGL